MPYDSMWSTKVRWINEGQDALRRHNHQGSLIEIADADSYRISFNSDYNDITDDMYRHGGVNGQADAYAFEMSHVAELDRAMRYFPQRKPSTEVLVVGEVLEYLMGFYSLSSARIISEMTERKEQELNQHLHFAKSL